ncbi:unnamed protein product [Medioppia subpectinata]|uniref:Uncharacterized protein n=1 Tax=Medioppia subpectinata TaxID=1979941 RepID=A0A7R9LTK7_9ACAR|nr:unnamed protein product [Medioppia subpectinata]CAG2121298.1 unnamed protein product [Medioppia subpectinata]
MYRKFMKSWRQYLRSWYMFFFSLPTPLPEWALAGNDYFMLDYLYRTGDGRPLLADEHMEAYKYTFQHNGLTAPLNWYRANLAGRQKGSTIVVENGGRAPECPDLVNQYMRKFLTHHSL